MFRAMRRFKQELSEEDCKKVLREELRGVLSVLGDDGYPYGFPIDFYYNEEANKIYFHGAKAGHKMDAIQNCDKVSFCVYDKGYLKEGDWALNIHSVICFGRIRPVPNTDDVLEQLREMARKSYPNEEEVEKAMQQSVHAVQMLELTIEHMSGKRVNEK